MLSVKSRKHRKGAGDGRMVVSSLSAFSGLLARMPRHRGPISRKAMQRALAKSHRVAA